jgi:hypothetical protein
LSGWSSTYGPPYDGVGRIYDRRPVAWGAAGSRGPAGLAGTSDAAARASG